MAVNAKTLSELVELQIAAVKSRSSQVVNTTTGSVFRAILEAVAGVVLWLQALVLRVLAQSRASTAVGTELDSWMHDFSFNRLGSSKAVGTLTFGRTTTTPYSPRAVLRSGNTPATAKDPLTNRSFRVTQDTSHANWSDTDGGYVLAQGAASITVPVQAEDGGEASNLVAGAVTRLTTSTAGVDTVTNTADFSGGRDSETDDAYRARFLLFLHSLNRGTVDALGHGIKSIAADMDHTVVSNETYADGLQQNGYFYVVVDEGGGTLSDATKTKVEAIVDSYRPIGTAFTVFAPDNVTVDANASLSTTANAPANLDTIALAAVKTYLSDLKLGENVSVTGVAHSLYNASSEITNVTGLTLNSNTTDIAINKKQVCQPGTITITVN